MTILEQALAYRAMGWSIIPIKHGSKLPALASWTPYKDAIADEETVTSWFSNTDNGIGLICGRVSSVIAVDIDVKNGEPDLTGLELPPTLCAKTGTNGRHMLYKWREGLVGASVGIRKGVDIRSDNSYIVIDPSIHPNGNAYEWINWGEEIATAPKWLESEGKVTTKKKRALKSLMAVVEGEGRNSSMASFIGKLLPTTSKDKWDSEILASAMLANATYKPPLSIQELTTIYESVCAMETARLDKLPKSENEEEALLVKEFTSSPVNATYAIAEYITKKYSIITIGEKDREMFVYRDGMYRRAENEVIFPEIQRILKNKVTKHAKNETLHKIADATARHRDIFSSAPVNLIPLKNGVYDTITKKILPHSPEYKFTFQFPITYRPDATCPKTSEFLDTILTPEQRLTMEEWIGYYFYRLYAFKKALIIVGEGDTGKTTLLEVIYNLLGKENISGVSLHKISGDRFACAQMYEKHGNIVDELEDKDVSGTGNFKVATGGGSITGEYKFGNQFSFQNFAKLTFACNRIPDVKESDDDAYFGRWMVMRIEKVITRKIYNYILQLTTEDERSGFFNLVMAGLERLLKNGKFSYSKDSSDTRLEMMRGGSSIAQFASDGVRRRSENIITKSDMYEKYVDFCMRNELAIQTKDLFGKKFNSYIDYASETQIYLGGKQAKAWSGVEVIPTAEAIVKNAAIDKEMVELANSIPL